VPGRTQVLATEDGTFRLQGYYLLWRTFPGPSTMSQLFDSATTLRSGPASPTTPNEIHPQAITLAWFRLIPFRSPLLRESRFLSLPPVTEMFHFTGLPSAALCVQAGIRAHYHTWVPPFGNPRINGCSAPPRGLSQPSTSFIGSCRQGIHHAPLLS
jgi:hypothetical protein